MAHEVRVPRLGWSMEEGVFVGWRKREGDFVQVGEVLFELEGEKASQEIESLDSGVLRIPPEAPKEGAVVQVGDLLAYLVVEGETVDLSPENPKLSKTETVKPAGSAPVEAVPDSSPNQTRGVVATPRARRAAKELGVDWRVLTGSGRGGRIRERDVRGTSVSIRSSRSVPISKLRRMIAERMLRSTRETAPVTLTARADATGLVERRNRLKAEASGDQAPSYTDLVVKLTALTLRDHPLLAGRWGEDCIELPDDAGFHIGIAVDAPDGLVVPVVRNAALRSVTELAADSRRLIDAARSGRLKADDMTDGVFTVTNLGSFGIDAFTPIINLPETAVLGMGAIRREPAVLDDGGIGSKNFITLSLTFDHRIVDGAPAARFLQALAARLAAPSSLS